MLKLEATGLGRKRIIKILVQNQLYYFTQGLLLDPSFLNYEMSGYRTASRSLNLAASESATLKYPPCFNNRV